MNSFRREVPYERGHYSGFGTIVKSKDTGLVKLLWENQPQMHATGFLLPAPSHDYELRGSRTACPERFREFCEKLGVKFPKLTRLAVVLFHE